MTASDDHGWPVTSRMHRSHTQLLVSAYGQRLARSPDAIIVPSYRPAAQLKFAADLARSLNCPLLVLSSQRSVASEVSQVIAGTDGLAVTVLPGSVDGWLRLSTLAWLPGRSRSYVDRSVKRNTGLLVARMMRWTRILFLDDDVSIDHLRVQRAVAHVGWRGPRVVAWRARHFPDNSVACHALRAVEVPQGVFVGGASLLVHVPGRLPFFPALYNEDWLFMHDFLARRRVGWVSDITQDPFAPFEHPERATREEFGDVLAEGLMALMHEGRSVLVACLSSYWHSIIDDRHRMLNFIERRLWGRRDAGHAQTRNGYDITQVLRSVQASREVLERTTAQALAEFTSAWRHDLYLWNSRLHRLPRVTRVEDALGFLHLTDVHRAAEEAVADG